MTLKLSKLSDNLAAQMVSALTETLAIHNFVQAYSDYAKDATANSVPMNANVALIATGAMTPALKGLSNTNAAAQAIQDGCVAFWAALVANVSTAFPTGTLLTPPPCAGIATGLTALFPVNTTSKLSLSDAAQSVALVLHTQTLLGGTVTYPGPLVAAIL